MGLLLLAAGPLRAETRTFQNPLHQGYRLDYCQAFGRACGESVATRWCRGQGYEHASDWAIDRGIGDLLPTMSIDADRACHDGQCDGFASISCSRDGHSVRLPNLGAAMQSTVITPDRRGASPPISPVEVQVLVPGCYQIEPGVLLCGTVHDYQHCRTLLAAGKVLGCRAGLAFDGAFAEPVAAAADSYDIRMSSRAKVTVTEGQRGKGRLRGEAQYRVSFALPVEATAATCLQRDRYVYFPTGPMGGLAEIGETGDCAEPLQGKFAPHEDDLLRAYDLCAAHSAWGTSLDDSIELLVAGLYSLSAAAGTDASPASVRIVAPYVTVRAPLAITCKH
jgi:hypothetical protein